VSNDQEPAAGTFRAEARDWLRSHVPAGPQPSVDTAEGFATDAAQLAARAALQVHGAIGYTQELGLHLWLTKVQALASAWGSQAGHRARVLAALTADEATA
jgi:alkylation response protein AidB-like acyl-CoA dehydrogenase